MGFKPEHFNFFRDLGRQVVKQRKENKLKRNDLIQLLVDANVTEHELKDGDYNKLTADFEGDGKCVISLFQSLKFQSQRRSHYREWRSKVKNWQNTRRQRDHRPVHSVLHCGLRDYCYYNHLLFV